MQIVLGLDFNLGSQFVDSIDSDKNLFTFIIYNLDSESVLYNCMQDLRDCK